MLYNCVQIQSHTLTALTMKTRVKINVLGIFSGSDNMVQNKKKLSVPYKFDFLENYVLSLKSNRFMSFLNYRMP